MFIPLSASDCIYWLIYHTVLLAVYGQTPCCACIDVLIIIAALTAAFLPAYVLLNCDPMLHCNVSLLAKNVLNILHAICQLQKNHSKLYLHLNVVIVSL